MRVVNLSEKVSAYYYDDMTEEWELKTKSIADVLWDTIDENVDDISFDAESVIRCCDCRWYDSTPLEKDSFNNSKCKSSYCTLLQQNFAPNFYCADGEKRR